ncbi:MAG TPA: hypothetical protein VNZ53_19350 [Steroidobacteraceae bacterium]|nr:hypothetical protein [Steroidobacteraceae bacterium]
MTNLYPVGDLTQSAGDGVGQPGAAPVGTSMQGNPQASQYTPSGAHVPAPQAGPGQTVNAPLSHDAMARGNIPLHTHPTNAAGPPGVDSLMAQLSRGQLLLNQSTYGQGSLTPANGGAGPQTIPAANVVSLPIGIGSTLNVANPPVYTGN